MPDGLECFVVDGQALGGVVERRQHIIGEDDNRIVIYEMIGILSAQGEVFIHQDDRERSLLPALADDGLQQVYSCLAETVDILDERLGLREVGQSLADPLVGIAHIDDHRVEFLEGILLRGVAQPVAVLDALGKHRPDFLTVPLIFLFQAFGHHLVGHQFSTHIMNV